MNTALPLIAIVLAFVAYVLGRKDSIGVRPQPLGLAAIAAIVFLGAKFGTTDVHEHWPIAAGLAAGALVVLLAEWSGVYAAALGLGTAGAALMPFLGKGVVTAEISLAVGAMIATLFAKERRAAAMAAITATIVASMDALGTYNTEVPVAAHFGTFLGLIAAASGVVILALKFKSWTWWLGPALLAAGAYLTAHRFAPVVGLGLPALLGIVTGIAAMFLLPEEESDPFRMAVATVLWLGLATLAYGPARGFGMNAALLCGLATPIALGRSRAVLSSGPLAVLIFVRLFTQLNGRESPALDISQHYVLIGFAIGAILPACYQEWRSRDLRLPALGGLLWGFLILGLPIVLDLLVEAKGLVGFMIGLGFGGFLLARKPAEGAQPLTIATGTCAASILLFARLDEVDSIARSEKMRYVAYSAIAIAALAVPLSLLVRRTPEVKPA